MRTGTGQQVWIKGPLLKLPGRPDSPGIVLEGLHFNMMWREGFSGPYSPNEAQRRSSTLSRARMVYDSPWIEHDPKDVDKLIANLAKANKSVTNLEGKVKDLEGQVFEGVIKTDSEAFLGYQNKDFIPLKRANYKKVLMRKIGFKWKAFSTFKEAWTHFEKHVLIYVTE